ncbi:MAG: CCA tRNA nucleotidyltransferase [Christensenellaceae bacterium]
MKHLKEKIPQKDRVVLKELVALFAAREEAFYLVGGYVRNLLLELPPSDMDIASSVHPQTLFQWANEKNIAAELVNEALGTVQLKIAGKTIEHTTFRKDSYAPGGGHMPQAIEMGVSMEEDALRRDFSVNALYYDYHEGILHDPTGRGLADLAAKKLCAATKAPEQMIKDDALRLLRMVRFACELGFRIDAKLFFTAKRYVGQIDAIPKERIIQELDKMMLSDVKYGLKGNVPPQKRAILYLIGLGLLEQLIPEFRGAEKIGQCVYHKYPVHLHTAATVGWTAPDLVLRYAALFHDVGKVRAWKEHGKMLGHDRLGEAIVKERFPALGADKRKVAAVALLVKEHMYDLNGNARESRIRIKAQEMGYNMFLRLAELREADVWGSGRYLGPVKTAEKFRRVVANMQAENVPMTLQALQINGKDLQETYAIEGPLIGQVLRALLRECAIHPAQNEKNKLLHHAKGYIKMFSMKNALRK